MFPADNFRDSKHPTGTTPGESEAESPDPPRNFTKEQLAVFDGTKDVKTGTDKPVYLSLNGIVFDVSKGRYVVVLVLPIQAKIRRCSSLMCRRRILSITEPSNAEIFMAQEVLTKRYDAESDCLFRRGNERA